LTRSPSFPDKMSGPDKAIKELEAILRQRPNDSGAARRLVTFLDRYLPSDGGYGAYTDCQRVLWTKFRNDIWIEDVLNPAKAAEYYKEWQAFLDSKCAIPAIAIAQLLDGTNFTIHNTNMDCELRLSLFEKKNVISHLCYECFKVQILPPDLKTLIQIHFLFRKLELPRDNYRKCMVELRDDVPYPYKAYIFCESEDEARICLGKLRHALQAKKVSSVYCGISHGCSEYGLKYPEFKYSDDSAHRSFERPASWDRVESEFWAATPPTGLPGKGREKVGISIRDLIGYRTWIDYAELIGDESWKLFRDAPSTNKPKYFAERVSKQSARRKAQMEELRLRLMSTA